MSHHGVAARLDEVRARIARAGGEPGSVRIVAVTKGYSERAVSDAFDAGVKDIGESYAQEMLGKAAGAPAGVRWHYLGALQRNKLAKLAPYVVLWHGLDSQEVASALAARQPGASALVEVRTPGGPGRHGVDEAAVPALVGFAKAAGLDVRGLMAVGPRSAGPGEVRKCFRSVASLAASLGLPELSMGMSGDFELAVAEGATILRLGRALFGGHPDGTYAKEPLGGAQPS